MKPSYRQGVIYQAATGRRRGEVLVSRRRGLKLFPFLHFLGKALVVISVVALLLGFTPLLAEELKQRVREGGWQISLLPKTDFSTQKPSEPVPPVEKRFQLVIPKIGVDSPVIANVDPQDPSKYGAALKQGVAHALGSGLPGEEGENRTIYLFAHSTNAPQNITRYNAIFYLLKDLKEGDEVIIWFWGKKFTYWVAKKEILPPQNTDYFRPQDKEEVLVLQTCWPPGTTAKQLVVIARPRKRFGDLL